MSKPTARQIAAFRWLENEMMALAQSNDIHSPSHGTEIDYLGLDLMEEHGITQEQCDKLNDLVKDVWCYIADLDKCTNRT